MKANSRTLGFLPKEALIEYIERGGVLGAKTCDNENELAGYLLFGAYPDYIRIAHLCVSENFRNQGIARALMDRLKDVATTQTTIRLRCRRDFPANEMWPRFGFVALDERPGRSLERDPLTLWCLTLAQDDQIGLFQAKVSDERLDVAIDAQVFFDLEEPTSEKTIPSKSLTSDFLVDLLQLRITDEMFNEINRQDDDMQRERSRNRAHVFPQVTPDPYLVEKYDSELREELIQVNRSSDESDIRQLAKAAASNVDFFVTRDRKLLTRSQDIFDLTKLKVLSPTSLIVYLHEISENQFYTPARVAGLGLRWERLTAKDILSTAFEPFLLHGERTGVFRAKLDSLVAADPENCWCELLWSGKSAIALRVVRVSARRAIEIHLSRVAPSSQGSVIEQFVISDVITMAVERGLDEVRITLGSVSLSAERYAEDLGFVRTAHGFVRFCYSRCLNTERALESMSLLQPEAMGIVGGLSPTEIERLSSPLCLSDIEQNFFLIPIRPGYAMSLVDRRRSADDMFGGEPSVLLRWDHVYYRGKDHHHMLTPPGRILWYVSGSNAGVVAVSHLDTVKIGKPQMLFKEYRRFGILRWDDIYKLCDGDPSREIMALRFSSTFSFRKPINLASLRRACSAEQHALVLQSPSRIPATLFRKIFCLGFPQKEGSVQ